MPFLPVLLTQVCRLHRSKEPWRNTFHASAGTVWSWDTLPTYIGVFWVIHKQGSAGKSSQSHCSSSASRVVLMRLPERDEGSVPLSPQICVVLSCFLKELCLSLQWSMWVLEALFYCTFLSLLCGQCGLSHSCTVPSFSSQLLLAVNLYISLSLLYSQHGVFHPCTAPLPAPLATLLGTHHTAPGPAPSLSPQVSVGKAAPFLRDPPQPTSCALGNKEWRSGRALPVLP